MPWATTESTAGGIPSETLGVAVIRQIVGTVLQDDVLFAGSIGNSISLSIAAPDQVWIAKCAEAAAVAADIAVMPMGYNALMGDMGTVFPAVEVACAAGESAL